MKWTRQADRQRRLVTRVITTLPASLIECIEARYPLSGPDERWADHKTGPVNLVVHWPDEVLADIDVVVSCERTPTTRGVWVRKVHLHPRARWHDDPGSDELPRRTIASLLPRVMRWLGACTQETQALTSTTAAEFAAIYRIGDAHDAAAMAAVANETVPPNDGGKRKR